VVELVDGTVRELVKQNVHDRVHVSIDTHGDVIALIRVITDVRITASMESRDGFFDPKGWKAVSVAKMFSEFAVSAFDLDEVWR
jgi:hypothetical protein